MLLVSSTYTQSTQAMVRDSVFFFIQNSFQTGVVFRTPNKLHNSFFFGTNNKNNGVEKHNPVPGDPIRTKTEILTNDTNDFIKNPNLKNTDTVNTNITNQKQTKESKEMVNTKMDTNSIQNESLNTKIYNRNQKILSLIRSLGNPLHWLYSPKGYRVVKSGFSFDYFLKRLARFFTRELFLNFSLNFSEKYFLIRVFKNSVENVML